MSIPARWLRIQAAAHFAMPSESQVPASLMWQSGLDWTELKYIDKKLRWTCLILYHHPMIFLGFPPRDAYCKTKMEQEKKAYRVTAYNF